MIRTIQWCFKISSVRGCYNLSVQPVKPLTKELKVVTTATGTMETHCSRYNDFSLNNEIISHIITKAIIVFNPLKHIQIYAVIQDYILMTFQISCRVVCDKYV